MNRAVIESPGPRVLLSMIVPVCVGPAVAVDVEGVEVVVERETWKATLVADVRLRRVGVLPA